MDDPNIHEQLVDHLTETDGATGPREADIKKWLYGSDENRKEYDDVRKIWKGVSLLSRSGKVDSLHAWRKVDQQIGKRQRKRQQVRNLAYVVSGMAASVIILFSLNLFTPLFSTPESSVTMSTNWGDRSEVTLPDGSVVRLNSGSKLKYHFNSFRRSREVEFSGEGFFEVSKTGDPFVVTTPEGLQVKVLGTRFNFQAYPGDKESQTTLIEGKVELLSPKNKHLILSPGQIATFDNMSSELAYASGNPSHMLSWMDNKLYMDNMSLKEVCIRLERWYDVQIRIKDAGLAENTHYTGVLSEETIIDVLDALCKLSPVQYQMKGKEIVITKKQQPMSQ